MPICVCVRVRVRVGVCVKVFLIAFQVTHFLFEN